MAAMTTARTYPDKIKKKLHRLNKQLYQSIRRSRGTKRILFIVGSQRSGTTMLNQAFENDWRTKTYGEHGLARGWGRGTPHRLKSYGEIRRIFENESASLLVAKPLVESQHTIRLLDSFEGAKAIWIYRSYKDKIKSSIVKFGAEPTYYNLKAVIDPNLSDHWYAENVSDSTRSLVARYYTEKRSLEDLKALAWYVRNVLFFETKLFNDSRVYLCKYEDIATRPGVVMKDIYAFLEISYPGDRIVRFIHDHSVKKGQNVELSQDLEILCSDLLNRFNELYHSKYRPFVK